MVSVPLLVGFQACLWFAACLAHFFRGLPHSVLFISCESWRHRTRGRCHGQRTASRWFSGMSLVCCVLGALLPWAASQCVVHFV